MMAIAEAAWLRTGDDLYREVAKRWAKGTAILFAASGIPVNLTGLNFERVTAKIVVDGTYDPESDSYLSFEEQVNVDATSADLSEEDAAKLKERVARHIEKGCTVAHTYRQETPVRVNVTVRK